MPKVTIDGKEYEFPDGLTIIQACERLGIEIPHFCYHPKLSVAGNCRMCLVEVEKAPTLQISCYTRIAEGQVIHTQNEKVKKARKGVLEFLLINHPLDCPICDQAGECPLQMNTMNWGPDRSRFEEEKEHFRKRVELGPHVTFDAERCIQCTRCIRFCDEVPKTGELGLFERSDRAQIGTFPGKKLDNDYSVCTVDICPVGALTNTEYRFENRVWFMKTAKSVCGECSRGCAITPWVNKTSLEVERMTPRRNDNVNDTWMCDEGRLSYLQWNPDLRLKQAESRNGTREALSPDAALARAAEAVADAVKKHGKSAVAGMASTFATNEELFLLNKLCGRVEILAPRRGKGDDVLKREDKSPNSRGAAAIVKSESLAADIAAGKIKVLVAVKPHRAASIPVDAKALKKLDALIVLDWETGALAEAATLLLPCAMPIEDEGSWTNEFGWTQRLAAVRPPAGDSVPAWKVLSVLLAEIEGSQWSFKNAAHVFDALARESAAFAGMSHAKLGDAGLRFAGAEGPSR